MLEILEQLGPWVSYPPRLAECLGGVKEAIFLTHILWWKKYSEDGWVFRTREDIERETGLSRWEQETARKNLRQLGILKEEYRGIPRRLFFYVDMAKLNEAWKSYIESQKENAEPLKPASLSVGRNTPQNTSSINARQQVGDQTQTIENQELTKSDFLGDLQQAGGNTSSKQVEIPPTSRLDFLQQAGGNTADYLVISLEKTNNVSKIKEITSDEFNHQQLEKRTKLEGVIEELKNAIKPDAIPKEFEELLLAEMLRAGFPRKSLRSKLDRENLLILKNHYGSWDAVILAFQKLQKLRESGQFLEWDWDRILRKADYILYYEPEPEFPVEKIPDIESLYRYFEKMRPPAKYVSRFVLRWKAFWRFQDLDYERTKRIIEKILKTYYNTVGAENGIEK